MSYSSRFRFIGDISIPKDSDKFVKEWVGGKSNSPMIKLNAWVQESKNNSAPIRCFGMKSNEIRTFNKDNEPISIAWEDRLDPNIISSVANFQKYIVSLDERKEFITQYDFISYLAEVLPKYDKPICATGRFIKSEYEGKIYDDFTLENVYAAKPEEKKSLNLTVDFFYNKECVDETDYAKTKRLYVNGYVPQYINKDEGEKFFEQTIVLDLSKFKDDTHKALEDYILKQIKIKSKNLMHVLWELKVIRGAEEVEINEDMLTDMQKTQIELGLSSLDDFKTSAMGRNINEYRFIRPVLKGIYASGPIDSGFTSDTILSELYSPIHVEDVEELQEEESKTETNSKEDIDVELKDLLG